MPNIAEGQYAVDHRLYLAGLDQEERHVDVGIGRVARTGNTQPASDDEAGIELSRSRAYIAQDDDCGMLRA